MSWVRRELDNEDTQEFYNTNYGRLLEHKQLANSRLDQVDKVMIEDFKASAIERVGPTTINRYLNTLRKALYRASYLWLIGRMPVIRMFVGGKAERERDKVFSDQEHQRWLDAAPAPLRSASIPARDCRVCRGEILALQKDCVHLRECPDNNKFWGVARDQTRLEARSEAAKCFHHPRHGGRAPPADGRKRILQLA